MPKCCVRKHRLVLSISPCVPRASYAPIAMSHTGHNILRPLAALFAVPAAIATAFALPMRPLDSPTTPHILSLV